MSAPTFTAFRFALDQQEETKSLFLRGRCDKSSAAARLALLSEADSAYIRLDLTAPECEALSAALAQCAREKNAAAQEAKVSQ